MSFKLKLALFSFKTSTILVNSAPEIKFPIKNNQRTVSIADSGYEASSVLWSTSLFFKTLLAHFLSKSLTSTSHIHGREIQGENRISIFKFGDADT